MPVESTPASIADLNPLWPLANDPGSQGDDHIRITKDAIKKTWPNVNAPVTATDEQMNFLVGVSSAVQTQIDGKAPTSHTHTIAQITSLQVTLDGKAAVSHTHPISAITDLQTELDSKAGQVHVHAIAQVVGLQADLDAKAAAATTMTAGNGLTGGGSLSANRTFTLGTPSSITKTSTNSVTSTSHTHELASSTVMSIVADENFGAVGTYAFLRRSATGQGIIRGNTYAGSSLRYSGITTRDDVQNGDVEDTWNDAPSGTWMALGSISAVSGRYAMTLFKRIS